MRSTSRPFLAIIISAFISSCASIYVPNAVNTPMLEQKGQTNIVGTIGGSSFDGQVSHALTENLGLMANANLSYSPLGLSATGFAETGLGYYQKNYDVFYGLGYGYNGSSKIKFDGEYHSISISEEYIRPFIQVDSWWGDNTGKIGASARMVWVKFFNHNPIFKNNNSLFFEPALTCKAGNKNLKFFCQGGLSLNMIKNNDVLNIPIWLVIGLELSFY